MVKIVVKKLGELWRKRVIGNLGWVFLPRSLAHHSYICFLFSCSKYPSNESTPTELLSTKTLFASILLVFLSFETISQDQVLHSQFYGIEEGLSHRDVQCIHQDRQGFMWFGTKYGLNRFDGYGFMWITEEKHGLPSNNIEFILEDMDGEMWLMETEGIYKYQVKSIAIFNPVTHHIQSLEEKFGADLPFVPTDIIGFAQNEKGHLVFVSKKHQLFTYTEEWKTYSIDLGEFSDLHLIHFAPNGEFWITVQERNSHQALIILDDQGNIKKRYRHPASNYLNVYKFDESGGGRYFSAYNNVVLGEQTVLFFYITPEGKQIIDSATVFNKSDVKFYNVATLGEVHETPSNYWVFTDKKQLSIIDKISGKTISTPNKQYFNLETTNDIFTDKNKIVWVATQFGIYRFQFKKPQFKKYLSDQKEKGHNELFACRQMTRDGNNHLWVRVENPQAVWKINLDSHEANDASKKKSSLPPLPSLSNTNYAITQTSNGDIIYSGSRDIFRVNPETHEYLRINTLESRRSIWAFYEDKFGRVWFGDQNNNELGYIENGDVAIVTGQLSQTERLYIYQFLEKENADTLWLVTNGGLFTLDIKNKKLLDRFWSKGEGKYYFPFDNIYHVHRDGDGSFWMATGGYGIIHVNISAGGIDVTEQFTRADGLPNNTIYAIYEDDFGNLWMSSDYGIAEFNKASKRFRGYTEKDGLAHNEFNRVSHFQDTEGNIYFGGLNGITAFHPKDLLGDTLTARPELVITNFEQFDGDQNKLINKLGDLRQQNTITIHPDDRFFRLEFALLTYNETDKIQYAFKVEGVDKDWIYQKENILRFSRLPYGNHVLHIKGQAANGLWSEKELQLDVVVIKPFYLQTWFLILTGLLFIISGPVFYFWRTARLRKRQEELEKTVEQRTYQIQEDKKIIETQNQTLEQQAVDLKSLEKLKSRFLANVSHELRTPLTLMLGPVNSLLKRKKKENDEKKLLQFIQRNAQQLQNLINEILDLSKLENNKLEVEEEPVAFYPYLKEQMAQFHSAATSYLLDFELKFQVDKSLNILLDKGKFEKIALNFLSNALKFTPSGGNVTLAVEGDDAQLQLSVRDTGPGIHPNDLPHVFDRFYQSKHANTRTEGGTGIGLSLVKELAGLLGGEVWVESELGMGSAFYFKFPKKTTSLIENGELTIENFTQTQKAPIIAQGQQTIKPKQQTTTILVVEDNRDLREYLQFLLSDYNVITAENGKVGLDCLLQTADCQLIISDLMMPVMDGFQFLKKLKADDRWRHLPVIMLTAKVNARAKLKALRIGVDDYLTKPFQEEELKARIENLLRNYRERMAYFSVEKTREDSSGPSRPVIAAVDAEWLEVLENVCATHLADSRLKIDFAAAKMHLSERQFYRRLKQLTGLTPNQYLQEIRLQRAKDMLVEGTYATVKEVSAAVGFKDVRYFSELFERHFAAKPSEMRD